VIEGGGVEGDLLLAGSGHFDTSTANYAINSDSNGKITTGLVSHNFS